MDVATFKKLMFRTQAAALTVLNLLYCGLQISATAPSAGDNAEGYAALCPLVNLASSTYAATSKPINNDGIVSLAAAINITISGEETVNEAIKEKDKEFGALPTTSKLKNACSDKTWTFCQKGAIKADELKDNAEYQEWKTKKRTQQQASAIASAVELIKQISESTPPDNPEELSRAANAKLKQALKGGLPPDSKVVIQTSTDSRAANCGQAIAGKGKLAGKNLAYDMMCLCGDKSGHTVATACATFATDAPDKSSTTDADLSTDWVKYKNNCKATSHTPALTPEAIRQSVATFLGTISKGQGTANKLTNILGKISGDGSSGCIGRGDADHGRCVYYGKAPATRGTGAIPWAAALLEVADTIEQAKAKAEQAKMIRSQLLHLNITLKRLAFASTFQQPPPQPQQTPTQQNIDSKEAECNKIESETD
uniref:Variant surface glycoprotein 1125.1294 n=1 Tax=Trypanosoma brucei TaxID=5691 RepID=A0A1J0R6X3_9TRYP|nr:variant surface glycoprotein 1125.1294 [Trypanosoma brucei]